MQQDNENILLVQQQLSGDFNLPVASNKNDLQQSLAAAVNHLINTDFARLVQILYRMDIPEKSLKQQLQQQHENAGWIIADMIIERELQKQIIRRQFKSQDPIPDDDKW